MYKNDRRMFDRFEVDFSVELKQPDGQKRAYAQCCDVSAGGVGLYTEAELMPQAKLELWLGIPDGHPPFRGLARVVWSKQVQEEKWRSGLTFEEVDFMDIRRIFDNLAKRG